MTPVGQPERATQNRVIALFRDELGYRYLGDWADRAGNSNIEEGLLTAYLTKRGDNREQIGVALHKLHTEADHHGRNLYANNQEVYKLLRYGVPVKLEAGKVTETVHLINGNEPDKNDFAIAVILSDMDADIAALEENLAKARQVKQGMMPELLTGRIRLV